MGKSSSTRFTILQKSFELIYKNGYQATSIDDIIAKTDLTKGAFYYHFKNKEEMGLAIIQEILYPGFLKTIVEPLEKSENVIDDIYEVFYSLLIDNEFFDIRFGCPVINLIEEMAPINDVFKKSLTQISNAWQGVISEALSRWKALGKLKKEVDAGEVSLFLICGYGGIRNTGKLYGKTCYDSFLSETERYLHSLEQD